MSKQPTRLADFQIPREPTGKAAGEPESKVAPTPDFHYKVQQVTADSGGQVPASASQPVAAPAALPPIVQPLPPSPSLPGPIPFVPAEAQALVPKLEAEISARRRPKKEKPADVPRTQVGARIPVTLAKRLARYCFEEEENQQDTVTAALEEYLTSYGY